MVDIFHIFILLGSIRNTFCISLLAGNCTDTYLENFSGTIKQLGLDLSIHSVRTLFENWAVSLKMSVPGLLTLFHEIHFTHNFGNIHEIDPLSKLVNRPYLDNSTSTTKHFLSSISLRYGFWYSH